ncbi:MAG: Bug family tripartite tricarboxylate transporter substrate binding protein, partial [Beijerinckiaceae bacterium]
GAALATADIMSGQVHAFVDSLAASLGNIQAGKVKALGVTSAGRQPQVPELPTLKEQGVDVVYVGWASIVAPKGTSAELVGRLNDGINRALSAPALLSRYRDLVIEAPTWSATETAAFMGRDRAVLTELVQATGIKVE